MSHCCVCMDVAAERAVVRPFPSLPFRPSDLRTKPLRRRRRRRRRRSGSSPGLAARPPISRRLRLRRRIPRVDHPAASPPRRARRPDRRVRAASVAPSSSARLVASSFTHPSSLPSVPSPSQALINCGHVYHLSCIKQWYEHKKSKEGRTALPHAPCPKCKEPFNVPGDVVNIYLDVRRRVLSSHRFPYDRVRVVNADP